MNEMLKVVKHLKEWIGLGILFFQDYNMEKVAYYDIYYATCHMTKRSIIGFYVKLGDFLLS